MAKRRSSGLQISWMTVTYRSVVTAVLTVVAVLVVGVALLFPDSALVQGAKQLGTRAFEKLGMAAKKAAAVGPQQAHFTALDGTIRVKKASSNTWVTADYGLPLEKGDVIQTSSEGMAKVFFPDGTSYTVKPDSLIVVEENSANAQQQTQVAVQVTTGTVDLSTAQFSQGSSSQVIVAGAKAALAPESAAMVRNDPRKDEHEIVVKRGSGEVSRGTETISLRANQKVGFAAEAAKMTVSSVVGAPTLIAPSNMMPLYVSGANKPVEFSWTPSANSSGYRLRVSRNPYFSSTVFNQVVPTTEHKIPGLRPGTYYWVVTAQDPRGHESAESERNQFTLVVHTAETTPVTLELEPFVQHGHVIEIKGKTDPQARVMVNGHEVPLVRSDGTFSFFTPALPNGENTVTITAQNAKGGVNTKQTKVVIE